MRQALITLTALAFLGTAFISGKEMAQNAPAFNTSLRVETVTDDWRVPVSSALFDKGDYRFQVGFGYLNGDSVALLLGEDSLPDFETFRLNVETAKSLFEQSLKSTPGRAAAWTALAWASLLSGNEKSSEAALRVSWHLAPANFGEASDRLALVDAIDRLSMNEWRQDKPAIVAVENDIKAIELYDQAYFRLLLSDNPSILQPGQTLGHNKTTD